MRVKCRPQLSHLGGLNCAAILVAGAGRDDQLRGDAAGALRPVRHVAAQVPVVAHREPRSARLRRKITALIIVDGSISQ